MAFKCVRYSSRERVDVLDALARQQQSIRLLEL
jgi:hypothetical protein